MRFDSMFDDDDSPIRGVMDYTPRIHEQKNSNVQNGYLRHIKQTEVLSDVTNING